MLGLFTALAALIVASPTAGASTGPTDWPQYLGGPDHSSFTTSTTITKANVASLKKDFKDAEKEGKAAYAERKGEVDALASKQKTRLQQLGEDLKNGAINAEEYEREVAALE